MLAMPDASDTAFEPPRLQAELYRKSELPLERLQVPDDAARTVPDFAPTGVAIADPSGTTPILGTV